MLDLRTLVYTTRNLAGVASRMWRIIRALFHEVIGFTFMVLAGWGTLWLIRSFRRFQGDGEELFKIAVVAVFVLMMGGFGVSSFRSARRISRTR